MKQIMPCIIIVLLLTVGVFSGCTETNNNKKSDSTSPIILYDDAEFITWVTNTDNTLLTYNNNELDALQNHYWYSLEYYAETEESLIDDTYKPECLAFHLSSQYDSIRDEFNSFLYDRSWACFYMKWAAKNMQDDLYTNAIEDFDKATDYTQQSTAHLNRVTDLLGGLT
jgi:hypothetical protein